MMICGTDYFLDLTPEKVDVVLGELRRRFDERRKAGVPTERKVAMTMNFGPKV